MDNDRIINLKKTLLEANVKVSCERITHLRDSYRETEGQYPSIRRAKFFQKHLRERGIFIDENPIVGTLTESRAGAQPYPESSCKWMKRESKYSGHLGEVIISESDKKLLEETADYWWDKCILSQTEKAWNQKYQGSIKRSDFIRSMVWVDYNSHPLWVARVCIDYAKVLNIGLEGIITEAEAELQKLPIDSFSAFEKRDFLTAVIIALNSVIEFAQRYSALAKEMAQAETNLERKRELERIADACQQVPARPPRSFYEAIQSFWFTHLASFIEAASDGHSPGRFSQYMYPFYLKDKNAGKISDEEVVDLLQLLFIRFTELHLFGPERQFIQTMSSMFQNIALGGVNSRGEDATNELDYLLLEAQKRVRLVQPTLSILYHDKMPDEFLFKALELVRTGIGMPAFFNNDLNIQRLLGYGASLEDARNHCVIGCVEVGYSHTCGTIIGGAVNMPKLLELALNDGTDPKSGIQVGLQTGDAKTFKSYDALQSAVKKQLEHSMKYHAEFYATGRSLFAHYMPSPFSSALVDDCIKNATDMNAGGARYAMDGHTPIGMIDFIDSLAAIKKLVFNEKSVEINQLLEALSVNFEGYEELHEKLLSAPKYGNDDDFVDEIGRHWYEVFYEEHQKYVDHLGKRKQPIAQSITNHFLMGTYTGALASGRKDGVPFADGSVSASPGKDKKGPTALIKSASKVIDTTKYASSLLNMKFDPVSLGDEEGLRLLLSMIKTYMDLGGHHVQFNVVSADMLKDAQRNPENYQDLIVRVAGFSAFFVHLDPVVQNEIIKRTELSL